jgi:RND family efflux transporter MFP subunit
MNVEARIAADLADDGAVSARRRRMIVIAAVLLVAAIAAIVWWRRHGSTKPVAADAAPNVTVVVPGRHDVVTQISAVGNVAARRDMPVGVAGDGGIVRQVLVEPGDWVRAGQVMAIVDRSVQQQQAAALAAAILQNRADAELAASNLSRAKALVGRGFISKADIDTKRAALDAANARVAVAQAQLKQQQALIGRLDVRAPTGGLVLTRAVEAGQIVGAGTLPLFRVAENGAMELQARLAEADLARLHVGAPATVTPVGTTRGIAGRIWQVSPIIDPTTRQGMVRIALPYDPALRPGGFAAAEIGGGAGELPLLPESAVMSDGGGNYVYVVGSDNRVSRRPVKVGEVDDRGVSIQSGLAGTERVVASAGAFLNVGDRVTPVLAATAR